MLLEILLALSGISTPLWSQLNEQTGKDSRVGEYVSPPERAMLAELAQLSELHINLKERVVFITTQHASPICRAVATSMNNTQLALFRRKVIDVEASILVKDAAYVGDYQIVPLSTVVSEFAPWTRRLEWLTKVAKLMSSTETRNRGLGCTGAELFKTLDAERQTGFSDIEDMATALLVVGQTAWVKTISSWVLYGQLPPFGSSDFLIQKHGSADITDQFQINNTLVPTFVTNRCAENVLAIGSALNHIRIQSQANEANAFPTANVTMKLLPANLSHIKELMYPLNSSLLEAAMFAINQSISRNALSQILPLQDVVGIAQVIQAYLLLGRGEFAMTLIGNVDNRLAERDKMQSTTRPVRKLGRLEDIGVKNAELDAILTKTWADLAALQSEIESEDSIFLQAKRYLRFRIQSKSNTADNNATIATLLPTPAFLHLELPNNSPLNIFLARNEIVTYAEINAYLVSIRRSEIRLSSLWKLTAHRRCHPAPLAPPESATPMGQRALSARRKRENLRATRMRCHWSSMSKALFVLNEFGAYLHGEIINNSWQRFHSWLVSGQPDQRLPPKSFSKSAAIFTGSMDEAAAISHDASQSNVQRDPRTMAQAHRLYLEALRSDLLLDHDNIRTNLKTLFDITDHYVALFARLQTVWQGLDLQEDDGVMDAFTNYVQDEMDVLSEMSRSRTEFEILLEQFLVNLKTIENNKGVNNLTDGVGAFTIDNEARGGFTPWKAKTLDRLIMKIDFLQSDKTRNEENVELDDSM